MSTQTSRQGFTLIELSIVLVIIGLIIGGVLVGQDLIKAAQVRATISQIEKYQVAANTFKVKYGGLPGDIANAADLGFVQVQDSGGILAGPSTIGDGLVMGCQDDTATLASYPPWGFISFGCENSMFWNHLSAAQLIPGNFTQTYNATTTQNIGYDQKDLYIPQASIEGNYVLTCAWKSANYFYITGINGANSPTIALSNGGFGSIQSQASLTPLQAYQIDAKIDDGQPVTGGVKAYDYSDVANLQLSLAAGSATTCRNVSDSYNTAGDAANGKLCKLQIKGTF